MNPRLDFPRNVYLLAGLVLVLLAPAVRSHPQSQTPPTSVTQDFILLSPKLPHRSYIDNGHAGAPFPPVNDPHFDDQSLMPPPPFLVPRDVRLLSFKKPVTSNCRKLLLGALEMVTDGYKEDEISDCSYIELDPGVKWIQIDLGQACDVYAVVLWRPGFNSGGSYYYHDTVVRCADDVDFVTGVKTLFNNDDDNSAGLGAGQDLEYVEQHWGKLIDFKNKQDNPTRTRFIRCYSNGNNGSEMSRWIEVEVYGIPCGAKGQRPNSRCPTEP